MSGGLRPATSADNAALLDLFGSVSMEGSLVLSTRRDPDFFALYRMQRGTHDCRVYETPSGLSLMGTALVREGWLEGRPCRVGYLGDLRARFGASRERILLRHYGAFLDQVRRDHGCDGFITAVMASNAGALNALARRSDRRRDQPRYHLWRRFSMLSVHFVPPARTRPTPLRVRSARAEDLGEIVARLDADHRRRPFGYRYDQGELEHRLERWPGMSLDRIYLARDRSGRLVGVTSVWDAAAVKRYRAVAYRGTLAWRRHGFNALARAFRAAPLPSPGRDFRYLYLCDTSIEADDPSILRALLDRILADTRRDGYHFVSFCEYEDDPLTPAFRGLPVRRLPFHLYLVTQGPETPELPSGRPGFEMALA